MTTHTDTPSPLGGLIEEGEALRQLAERAPARPSNPARGARRFHVGMAIAFVLVALVGFGPSYYLRGASHSPPVGALLHVHAFVFTAWLLLLLTQTALVSARRTRLHMRLGLAGAVLAAVMVPVGILTAIDTVRSGTVRPGLPPLVFLIMPLGQILIFAGLVGAAVWLRRRPELHRRLMVLANVCLITPAIARIPWVEPRPLLAMGLSALFVVAGIVHDRRTRGRAHPVYVWGGLALVLSGPLRIAFAHTEAWQSVARWLVA